MTLNFAEKLVQHYFLEIEPSHLQQVKKTLQKSGEHLTIECPKVGKWILFAWLDRPSIWAIRPIEVTSGLDTFLLDDKGCPGITDVAELITMPISSETASHAVVQNWDEFVPVLQNPGVLFSTFLWIDWTLLEKSEVWQSENAPSRSSVLGAIRIALDNAFHEAQAADYIEKEAKFMLSASLGDADLLLYGFIKRTKDLDMILYILTQMGCDCLAPFIGLKTSGPSEPVSVFRASHTEIAVDLNCYSNLVESFKSGQKPDQKYVEWLEKSFEGKIQPEIGFVRGRGSLVRAQGLLSRLVGVSWYEKAVLGKEDLVLATEKKIDLKEAVLCMTAVDAASANKKDYPRRFSLRLGLGKPLGRDLKSPERTKIFKVDSVETTETFSETEKPRYSLDENKILPLLDLILEFRRAGWREDMRTIERMVERCVTVSKTPYLREETKRMLFLSFERLSGICETIIELERSIHHSESMGTDEGSKTKERESVEKNIRLFRSELVTSGAILDRVFSHHSKGVISLLLNPARECRGTEHIGSEVGLSSGLAKIFGSPIEKISARLSIEKGAGKEQQEWFVKLKNLLNDKAQPIIFASYDQDFFIRTSLNLVRVPTWALWHSSSASHLLHETGHALVAAGNFSFFAKAVMKIFHPTEGESSAVYPELEKELIRLGYDKNTSWLDNSELSMSLFARAWRKAHRDLEEIIADVVSRMFCYSDGPVGDERHLHDYFDYFAPSTTKNEPDAINSRLLYLLAAQVTVCLLRDCRASNIAPLAHDSQTRMLEIGKIAIGDFSKKLALWCNDFVNRDEHKHLDQSILSRIDNLPQDFQKHLDEAKTSPICVALFLATLLNIKPLHFTDNQSLFRATHIWGNAVEASLFSSPENESVQAQIIDSLIKGKIPNERSPDPEKIPREISWRYRADVRREIPAHIRMAQSFYLRDLVFHGNNKVRA